MKAITEEFKFYAKELAELYHHRKFLVDQIVEKENKLRELGAILEFTDSLEQSYGVD